MTFLSYLFRASSTAPTAQNESAAATEQEQEEQDDIYPVHMLDDSGTLTVLITSSTMVFNDVLDANKIHKSLVTLLEIGDWKKCGGRLRQKTKDKGQLEIYVPRKFTPERPAVVFTTERYEMAIEDHAMGSKFPRASQKPQLHPAPEDFREFVAPPNAPETIQDYISGDIPMLSLHITSFKNSTVVGLVWPHTLMDVMGHQALLHAWSLVLAGKTSEVPPVLGAREDLLVKAATEDICTGSNEDYALKDQIMGLFSLLKVVANLIWDCFWWPNMVTKTICLPKHAVDNLRREAQLDLMEHAGPQEKPFISEGDVLTAWTMQAVAASLPRPRAVTAVHALNARFRLRSLINAPGVFIQNMVVGGHVFVESAVVAGGRLGQIALVNRQHLASQATESQILANIRQLRKQPAGRADPVAMICGSPDALLMPYTNWTRANLTHAIDFSAAVIRRGENGPDRFNPPGTIVYHHSAAMRQPWAARNFILIYGKDHGENCWITGRLLPPAWKKIEEDIEHM